MYICESVLGIFLWGWSQRNRKNIPFWITQPWVRYPKENDIQKLHIISDFAAHCVSSGSTHCMG